jgi:transcriptional regulator with XRE-family HTH domain
MSGQTAPPRRIFVTPPRYGRSKDPRPIDLHVGTRAQQRRLALSLSLKDVASRANTLTKIDPTPLTPKRLKDFEEGCVRLNGTHLVNVAAALRVSVGYFYDKSLYD